MQKLLLLFLLSIPSWGAWGYYILHEPDTGKVSGGPHTNFVVYIDTTHNDLRVTGSMGLVTDAQGDDIAPFSDASCTTMLEHDREAYDGTTGRWRGHVKISSLSSSTDVYLCFQNASQTTYLGSATNTWTAYVARYGFGDGTTISVTDSTGNGHTLTNSGAAASTDAQMYGSALFVASESDFMYRNAAAITATPLTITAWAKSSSSTTQNLLSYQEIDTVEDTLRLILYLSNVAAQVQAAGSGSIASSSSAYSTTDWFHAASVFTSDSSRTAYYNGANSGNTTASHSPTGINQTKIGAGGAGINYMDGRIDEIRTRNVASDSGWIATEYNSGIPSTFWVVGSPTAVSGGSSTRRRVIFIP